MSRCEWKPYQPTIARRGVEWTLGRLNCQFRLAQRPFHCIVDAKLCEAPTLAPVLAFSIDMLEIGTYLESLHSFKQHYVDQHGLATQIAVRPT